MNHPHPTRSYSAEASKLNKIIFCSPKRLSKVIFVRRKSNPKRNKWEHFLSYKLSLSNKVIVKLSNNKFLLISQIDLRKKKNLSRNESKFLQPAYICLRWQIKLRNNFCSPKEWINFSQLICLTEIDKKERKKVCRKSFPKSK